MISLRTSGKRLPGKKQAIYIGSVIAVLVLSYNLTKDFSFILVADKEEVFNYKFHLRLKYQTNYLFLKRSVRCSDIVLAIVSA